MISGALYQPIFLYTIIFLTFIVCNRVKKQSFVELRSNTSSFVPALILMVVMAYWIGQRPFRSGHFGDSTMYAWMYHLYSVGLKVPQDIGQSEWLWHQFMYWCTQRIYVSTYFTIIAFIYFGFTLWACKRFTPNDVLITFLFCLAAISFFTYGTNGIRNGTACSIVLLMLTYIDGNIKDKIIAVVLAVAAISIHKSTTLPIAMAVMSLFIIKSFKTAYTFWALSIVISLVLGNSISNFFMGFGFDDRMTSYGMGGSDGLYTKVGFRWDFLIYSMMPILLGYYIVIKRGIRDRKYEILLNTYTLANAFWVMVIRAAYSNRFAYLSWFMYPIVLAYPLLKLDIWGEEQGKYLRQIMLAHVGFTWFMDTFYWS